MSEPDKLVIIFKPDQNGDYVGETVLFGECQHDICFRVLTTNAEAVAVCPSIGYLNPKQSKKIMFKIRGNVNPTPRFLIRYFYPHDEIKYCPVLPVAS